MLAEETTFIITNSEDATSISLNELAVYCSIISFRYQTEVPKMAYKDAFENLIVEAATTVLTRLSKHSIGGKQGHRSTSNDISLTQKGDVTRSSVKRSETTEHYTLIVGPCGLPVVAAPRTVLLIFIETIIE